MAAIEINEAKFDQLKSKTALITGGANGIGKAAAVLFHAYGANVVIGDLDEQSGHLLVNKLGPQRAVFLPTDVTKWDSLKALFQAAHRRFGSVDYVCANAGMAEKDSLLLSEDLDSNEPVEPDFSLVDVNLNGALRTAKLALHYFQKNPIPGGALVLTGSAASYFGGAPIFGYSATKHALLGLMRSLAAFSPMRHVRVNLVAPWMTETEFSSEATSIWGDLPKNTVNEVARAILIAFADDTLHGRGLYVAKTVVDFELPLYQQMPSWMTQHHADLFEQGRQRLAAGMGFPTEHYLGGTQ